MKNIYTIYKAKNLINGKCYIGYTNNWYKRKISHSYAQSSSIFHKAIRKYGLENFEWSILYQDSDKEHTYNIMEPLYILIYDSYLNGYNMTTGGEGQCSRFHSEETRKKLKESHIGLKWSENKRKNSSWRIKENAPRKRLFIITDPTGKIYKILGGLKDFCKRKNLPYSSMCLLHRTGFYPKKSNIIGWKII